MIAPSISFDDNTVTPIWVGLSVDDVQELICADTAELGRLRQLQAESPFDYRYGILIKAWEQTQDQHWSWRKEILNAGITGATQGPEGLGAASVGSGN